MADINNAITHIQGSNGDRYEIGDSLTQAEIQEICAGVATEGGTLPIASGTGLGCIKIGNGLNITSDGVLSTAQDSVTPIGAGGTDATNAAAARINLGFEYGDEIPTTTPSTGNGAVYFFEDELNVVPISEGGTDAVTADEALANLGGARIDLLWENSSPDSSFADQTLSLNLSEYDIMGVLFKNQTTGTIRNLYWTKKGERLYAYVWANVSGSSALQAGGRGVEFFDSEAIFGEAYKKSSTSTSTGTADNSWMIPLAIYGIKGVI